MALNMDMTILVGTTVTVAAVVVNGALQVFRTKSSNEVLGNEVKRNGQRIDKIDVKFAQVFDALNDQGNRLTRVETIVSREREKD